jgi:sorbitol-specific phosphotransferase system component IIC
MAIVSFAVIPLFAQAGLMLVDEFIFHHRRGLPKWECVGHPIDTASVLVCYAVAVFKEPSSAALGWYLALACGSCLLVTKDEFLHASVCTPSEHWIHSMLFVLHPIVLGVVAWQWLIHEYALAQVQLVVTLLFGLYQVGYWCAVRKPVSKAE